MTITYDNEGNKTYEKGFYDHNELDKNRTFKSDEEFEEKREIYLKQRGIQHIIHY